MPNPDYVDFMTETVIQSVFDELSYSQALSLVIRGHLHSKQCETLFGVSPIVWMQSSLTSRMALHHQHFLTRV